MGTENDIDSFIQLQKQKLAQERENLHQKSDYGQSYQQSQLFDSKPNGAIPDSQRRQAQPEVIQNGQPPNAPRFGEYDEKRKKFDEERKREYNERNQHRVTKPNVPNAQDIYADGDIFSKLGQYGDRRKVLDVERNNEYNKQLAQTDFRRTGKQSNVSNEPGLPGLRDHPSANQKKMKQRNAEYNEFLQSQQQKMNNRFADKKGLPVETAPLGRAEYDRTLQTMLMPERSRPYQERSTQRTSPRQPAANPTYEELLSEKRRQEQSYRSRNDPEAVRSQDFNSHRQPDYRNDERRFDDLDRQYERRKVKFANDRSIEDNTDVYDWEYSKQGRSRSFYQDAQPKPSVDPYERSRSVPPKQEEMTGLAIGHSETASAAKKRKDQYRQDLEQQISSHRGNNPHAHSRENVYPPAPKPMFSEQPTTLLDDRRPLASILNERRDLVDTSPRGNAVRLGLGPGLLEKGFSGLYEPSVLSQPQQQLSGYTPPQPYQTPSDAAYNYYGTHDPLAGFTAPPLGPPQHPRAQQQQQPPPTTQPYLTTPRSLPSKPTAAVGAFPSEISDRGQQKKDSQLTYQQELRKQMEEKQRIERAKKAEQEAYDRKLNEEIANYNPFGRGGAGAPMKDTTGNVIADLRSMKQANNGQTPRPEIQNTAAPVAVKAAPQLEPTLPNLNLSYGADVLDTAGHARGGHGIFGEPKTEVQKTATDKYKEELQKQIDEKKRVAELEKQKLREEEEREMKRLEEDRIKIQKEFEAEQAKAKAKEEETRRKNEQMKEAAEEKRRLAEQQRDEADRKRKEKDEEARQRQLKEKEEEHRQQELKQTANRPESPPIPTLRSKTQPPGSMEPDLRENSPPIPTQRAKTQHDTALTGSRPVIRDPEPSTSRAPDHQPAPSNRPESRAKSAEVLNQLAHMRQQLQQERQRVENALSKQKADVDIYDPRERITKQESTDVFETARHRKPVSARRTGSKLDNHDDSPQDLLVPQTANSLLHSDSAFIDDSGMRAAFPDDFDTLATNQNARRRRREKTKPKADKDTESVVSVDPDRITKKNQDRLRKLKAIAGDEISLDDPDDIIDRFMTKQNHNRPPSGQTLTDDSWINR